MSISHSLEACCCEDDTDIVYSCEECSESPTYLALPCWQPSEIELELFDDILKNDLKTIPSGQDIILNLYGPGGACESNSETIKAGAGAFIETKTKNTNLNVLNPLVFGIPTAGSGEPTWMQNYETNEYFIAAGGGDCGTSNWINEFNIDTFPDGGLKQGKENLSKYAGEGGRFYTFGEGGIGLDNGKDGTCTTLDITNRIDEIGKGGDGGEEIEFKGAKGGGGYCGGGGGAIALFPLDFKETNTIPEYGSGSGGGGSSYNYDEEFSHCGYEGKSHIGYCHTCPTPRLDNIYGNSNDNGGGLISWYSCDSPFTEGTEVVQGLPPVTFLCLTESQLNILKEAANDVCCKAEGNFPIRYTFTYRGFPYSVEETPSNGYCCRIPKTSEINTTNSRVVNSHLYCGNLWAWSYIPPTPTCLTELECEPTCDNLVYWTEKKLIDEGIPLCPNNDNCAGTTELPKTYCPYLELNSCKYNSLTYVGSYLCKSDEDFPSDAFDNLNEGQASFSVIEFPNTGTCFETNPEPPPYIIEYGVVNGFPGGYKPGLSLGSITAEYKYNGGECEATCSLSGDYAAEVYYDFSFNSCFVRTSSPFKSTRKFVEIDGKTVECSDMIISSSIGLFYIPNDPAPGGSPTNIYQDAFTLYQTTCNIGNYIFDIDVPSGSAELKDLNQKTCIQLRLKECAGVTAETFASEVSSVFGSIGITAEGSPNYWIGTRHKGSTTTPTDEVCSVCYGGSDDFKFDQTYTINNIFVTKYRARYSHYLISQHINNCFDEDTGQSYESFGTVSTEGTTVFNSSEDDNVVCKCTGNPICGAGLCFYDNQIKKYWEIPDISFKVSDFFNLKEQQASGPCSVPPGTFTFEATLT